MTARFTIVLPDRLGKRLRDEAESRFGGRKGDISRAVEVAIREWLRNGGDY